MLSRKGYSGAFVVMSSKYLGTDITYLAFRRDSRDGSEGRQIYYIGKQISSCRSVAERKRLEAEYQEKYLNPYAAAGAGYIDDVIEPAETRYKLITALKAISKKFEPTLARKHGNMPV